MKRKEMIELINQKRLFSYKRTIERLLIPMFEYSNLPEGVERSYIEKAFNRYGLCGFDYINDEVGYYTDIPILSDNLDKYGIATNVQLVTRNGINGLVKKRDIELPVGWNDSSRCPDTFLDQYSNLLSEVDKSILCNVINARLNKVALAKDTKEKAVIDAVLAAAVNGELTSMIKSDSIDTLINPEANTTLPIIPLNDVKDIEKVQYLTKLYDDIVRRLCTLYGCPLSSTGKMAQQSVEEIQGYDNFSMITPEDRLFNRKKWIDNINQVFGLNISVELGKCWKQTAHEVMEINENMKEVEEDEIKGISEDK